MGKRLKIGVLVSGSGTNLQSIIDRCQDGSLPAVISCVISNNEKAYALERARRHGITAICLKHTDFNGRTAYDAELVKVLQSHGVELVVLAGFMRIITPGFIEAFPNAIMNIHPALLPAFPGLHAQRQALEYGVKVTGCTVHFVDAGTDTGPIVMQAIVSVEENDSEDTLSARIQMEEHRIFPEAIRLFAEGRLKVDGRKVVYSK
ncbi:phosphoribosylglycinamide formyltransferase [Geotalea toluenoxydans]|uniref:phosphoribosylglycinamide formyltransferase n=1 Tax=Geotalea toluenoxydans TaxID=421624 RepID=UPI0006D22AB0|nr:phosphoribosylglycinamide formyltransferase [Geotalea toluenoxydans]